MRATAIVRRAAVKAEKVVDTLVLGHAARKLFQGELTGEGGLAVTLDLDRETALDEGDALKLEDGRLVAIRAASERLIEVTSENPARLLRIGWHLGDRHVAMEVGTDAIYVPSEPGAAEIVRGLGGAMSEVARPFRPERGGHGHHHHGHDHGGHDHAHHAHEPHANEPHGHDHGHAHDHAHGADCGGGHDHGGHAHAHGHAHDHR